MKRPLAISLIAVYSGLMGGAVAAGEDPLALVGLEASRGAAAGYVDDQGCRRCHPREFDSFQQVGMAQSMRRPAEDVMIEDFDDNHFFHEPSGRHYEMHWDGTSLRFERYQLTVDGERFNRFETGVDWILGSGNRTRSYLFRTPGGELYQLPIGWYTQDGEWGMSPGFEAADHPGVNRRARRECLFCHNAYPELPVGGDHRWQPHVFPEDLPEGIGCQRCHGPGAEHIRTVLRGRSGGEIRDAIVNPARLPPERRDDVCNQCHLLPAVAMIGTRRFERGDFSFRPGEVLSDYMLHVDIEVADEPPGGRFEINHHAYRLRQSSCFVESAGKLSCLSCHDPHRKLARPAARDHFRDACLQCHQRHDELPAAGRLTSDGDDCVACHMPERRTDDVIKVTMTDHRIAAGPFNAAALTAPKEKVTPSVDDVYFYLPGQAPEGALAGIYRAVTVLHAAFNPAAMQHLAGQLGKVTLETPVPFLYLAKAQMAAGAYENARRTLEWVLERRRDAPQVREWLGIVYLRTGKIELARDHLQAALERDPDAPETLYNLALIEIQRDNLTRALELLDRAVALRPNLAAAWYYRGSVLHQTDRPREAEASLHRALGIDPTLTRAYAELVQVLRMLGKPGEAASVLQHGTEYADRPGALQELVDEG
ncbi:MAG: tetratricopeptide repeat protein [Wenzhouxiangellaceae bacterium]